VLGRRSTPSRTATFPAVLPEIAIIAIFQAIGGGTPTTVAIAEATLRCRWLRKHRAKRRPAGGASTIMRHDHRSESSRPSAVARNMVVLPAKLSLVRAGPLRSVWSGRSDFFALPAMASWVHPLVPAADAVRRRVERCSPIALALRGVQDARAAGAIPGIRTMRPACNLLARKPHPRDRRELSYSHRDGRRTQTPSLPMPPVENRQSPVQ
jgi:hypothetical protein